MQPAGPAAIARTLDVIRAAQVSAFTLAHSTRTPGGVLITPYVRSGEVRTGTFEEVE
jgi:hypothetical protein